MARGPEEVKCVRISVQVLQALAVASYGLRGRWVMQRDPGPQKPAS